jgi:hypothetical protein
VLIIGIGLVSSLIYMRERAELDKQRDIAANFARQFMEETRRNLFPALVNSERTIELETEFMEAGAWPAVAKIKLYKTDAHGTRVPITTIPSRGDLIELEVTVEWQRMGRLSDRRFFESLHTYVFPDVSL